MTGSLPIDPLLPKLCTTLHQYGRAVLQAPPGAGKTTRVPLALLGAGHWPQGKIIMLEPRRLAARGAAARLAETLGEQVGQTVGYRIRGESKISANTRIEVVTEGILTRMLQADAELTGVSVVIFDEFHERSLHADLGLALTWDVAQHLREDLCVLVMSATLDAGPVAALLDDAPILTSEGRTYPITQHFLPRPLHATAKLETEMANLILEALDADEGGVLAFLPGEGEIRRTLTALKDRLPPNTHAAMLYGAQSFKDQRAALAPWPDQRKVVLATSIAETSLTIPDIRIVVDSGLARRARHDPNSGMARLVTEKASRAEATQRAGRAGRTAPGTAYALWAAAENGARPAFAPPEIATTDLAPFALDLAAWGAAAHDLALLDPPPVGALGAAKETLRRIGALDGSDKITPHGRRIAQLPTHPRLAHMVLNGGQDAPLLAALVQNRDPLPDRPLDLTKTLRAVRTRDPKTVRPILADIKAEAQRLSQAVASQARNPAQGGKDPLTRRSDLTLAQTLALAYPDRIAGRRPGDTPRYIMSGGRGAQMDPSDDLATAPWLVIADLDGKGPEPKIRRALSISLAEIRESAAGQIQTDHRCQWSKRDRKVIAQEVETLGALPLASTRWTQADPDKQIAAMLDGIPDIGLQFNAKADRFRARVTVGRASGLDLPAMDTAELLANRATWLAPYLSGITTQAGFRALDLLPALEAMLDWDARQQLDQLVPSHVVTPAGRKVPVDYASDPPEITVKLQEMLGLTQHPTVGPNMLPIRVTFLSPAGRPIQTTADVPRFWDSSYADVRKDMRARYPRHRWPENPREADPSLRTRKD